MKAEVVELLVPMGFDLDVQIDADPNLTLVFLEVLKFLLFFDDGRDDQPLAVELFDEAQVF